MEWMTDTSDKSNNATEATESADAKKESPRSTKIGSKKGVLLILAGLVVTGLAAGYGWMRRLPKD
jgi:hypothetical protein